MQLNDALNLMFKYFGNKFNNMQSQLTENSTTLPFKKAKRKRPNIISNKLKTKKRFNFNVDILDDTQESIHRVENNDTKSPHS